MKRLLVFITAASLIVPGVSADAMPAGKDYRTRCQTLSATVPVTREQAQSYLPPGFRSMQGSADQEEVPYVYISSFVCGEDLASPSLTMAAAGLLAQPPKRYQMGDSGANFVLAATIGGPEAQRFETSYCLEDLFVDGGEIAQAEHAKSVDVLAGQSTVASEVLSLTMETGTVTIMAGEPSTTRWFYEGDNGVEFFDWWEIRDYVRLGSGTVRFDQPFLDLPLAAAGPALAEEGQLVIPARKCAR